MNAQIAVLIQDFVKSVPVFTRRSSKIIFSIHFAVVLLFTFFSVDVRGEQVTTLDWLSGCWVSKKGDRVTEEIWMEEKGGMMPGMGRTYSDDTIHFYEWLKITFEKNGDVIYTASPFGKKSTQFVAVQPLSTSVTFENPEHDFPQKIRYELTSQQALTATVSGIENGKDTRLEINYVSCEQE